MNSKTLPENRLIIASNRLPVALNKDKDGQWHIGPGTGGLVTAIAPVLKNRGGTWIGWPGNVEEDGVDAERLLEKQKRSIGYTLKTVNLSAEEKENYYKGFANEILWPLFHDSINKCNFNPDYWVSYQQVNQKFAGVIAQNISGNDLVWVHDYHLMGVASELREMGVRNKIAFFLHIPFPTPDIYVRLPWRFQFLNYLLEYNLIGFQTLRDRRNFVQCIRTFIKETRGIGKGQVFKLRIKDKEVRIGAFPISIDFNEFENLAKKEGALNMAWYKKKDYPNRKKIFSVDRLDYTKGIPEKLKAFRNALIRYPYLQECVTLIQVVVPSRREIEEYAALKIEIEQLVGEINGQFTRPGWIPIHYMFRSIARSELAAYYRTSEIALVTPLKDGMNLVAKEYCASNIEGNGVLILSQFAGVAAQFQRKAILVNPHDIEGMADAIHQAFQMPDYQRKKHMRNLRQNVKKYNIFWWLNSFLNAAFAKNMEAFPIIEDYLPLSENEQFDGL